jgi:hypothetical protein
MGFLASDRDIDPAPYRWAGVALLHLGATLPLRHPAVPISMAQHHLEMRVIQSRRTVGGCS